MTTLTEYAEAAEWFVKELADFRKFADLLRGADKVMVLRLCEFEELAATVLRQLAEGKVLCDGEPVAFRYRYGTSPWTLTREPTAQWAQDHSGFEERPLYAAATQGETS